MIPYHPPYGKDANFRIYSDIYTAPPGGFANFFINGGTRFEGSGVLSGVVRVNDELQTDCIVSLYSEDTQELLQSTTTNASGEFIFEGLNTEELFYIVAKEPSNAWEYRISSRRKPIIISYPPMQIIGELYTNDLENGLDGSITVLGGQLPLSVEIVDPLPFGLTPIIQNRTLTVIGTSQEWGRKYATIRVRSRNNDFVDIPVTVDINKGWAPESLGVAPKIWFDHDSGVTDVSGAASVWTNKGIIGGEAGQSSAASRPLILGAELNGKRVLSFDGTNDFMAMPASAQVVLRNVSNATVFAVAKKRTEDTSASLLPNRALIQFSRSDGNHRFGAQIGSNTISAYNRCTVTTRPLDAVATIEQTSAASADAVFGAYAMYHAIWDGLASRHSVFVNAKLSAEAAPLSTASTTSNTTTTAPVRIGASGGLNVGSETAFADMDLACLLVWSEGLLSEADRQRLEGYYADVYALAGNLPIDHPFRHAAPYRATPVLQQSFGADPVVLGFVSATSGGNAGAATGPAVTPLGTWFNGGPSLSSGQGVEVITIADDIAVTLTSITPPATPAQAVLLDHKGMHIVSIPLTAASGGYSGSVPGTLDDGEVYYLKIEAQ